MPCCSSHKLHMQNIRPAALPRMLDVVSSSGNWKGYSGPSKPFSYPQVLRSCLQLALCTRTVCELLVCVAAERRRGLQQARDSSIYPIGRRYVHILAILSPQISSVLRCWYQKGARHGQVTQTLCSCWKKELRYPGLDLHLDLMCRSPVTVRDAPSCSRSHRRTTSYGNSEGRAS